jgi:hypothetical protein
VRDSCRRICAILNSASIASSNRLITRSAVCVDDANRYQFVEMVRLCLPNCETEHLSTATLCSGCSVVILRLQKRRTKDVFD